MSTAHGKNAEAEEILLIDKPKGISSFDVIRALRKRLGVKKMGHAGTLDPLASGLLIVGVGRGTKRLTEFIGLPKTYRMTVLLGTRTDTGDLEGRVIERQAMRAVNRTAVKRILESMIGELLLPVPAYSAVKHKGQPLYRYARRGIAVPVIVRKTRIMHLKLLGIRRRGGGIAINIELEAGSGTYARAVAEEIGHRVGAPATVAELRRTRIGTFDVTDALPLFSLFRPPRYPPALRAGGMADTKQ